MPPNNPFLAPQPPAGGQQPVPGVPPVATPVAIPQAPAQPMPGEVVQTYQQPAPVPVTPAPAAAQAPAPVAGEATKPTPKNPNSTQSTLQLSEIRDNMVIMMDGSFRAVVQCQSINFDLMSDAEREAIEFSYQNFLNSLNFPVQIIVRSQRIDIGPYIEKLSVARRQQDNMLLGVLMDDYINFIDILSQEVNIMDKSFYIVVPYFPAGTASNLVDKGKGFFSQLFARPKNTITRIDDATYQKAKDEIKNGIDTVISGLFQMGIQSAQLDTKALGRLYYNFYNPDTAVHQPLGDFSTTTTTFVKKAPSTAPQAVTPGATV